MQTADALLEAAVERLGYDKGEDQSFLPASHNACDFLESTWLNKGEWLSLAVSVGAQKLFFIDNNPVIVFVEASTSDKDVLSRLYQRVWCMSRPRLLFLAKPGELAVYDLASRPPAGSKSFAQLKPLAVVQDICEVAEKLKRFHREEIETGGVFEAEKRFGKTLNYRADKALIRDLKTVRKQLADAGLCDERLKYAHALIGRSIFIRYLEDRGVLTKAYFEKVAQEKQQWVRLLDAPADVGLSLDDGQREPLYPRVLRNHAFTYALFRKLAEDFNGDMFPGVDIESESVTQQHLNIVRQLTYGDVGQQRKLFFFAYQFDVIPIELISSIYEEFYHEQSGQGRSHGAFYTPPALVEFLLSKVLTPRQLALRPRILDPACGSGIFLVEAFKRIVRSRMARQKRRLRFDELQKILRDQLAGIDINSEAIRVAAFNLYLAMLHYLEPSDILAQIRRKNRLPCLVFDEESPPRVKKPKHASLNCLVPANAFDTNFLNSKRTLEGRFSPECFDIVVGNPPWGSPGASKKDSVAREQNRVALEWCEQQNFPVGDQERSQTFIWRALDFLKPHGKAALLVSTGVFLKHHPKSVSFRRTWLRRCLLDSVFNFANTRHVFFGSAVAPFAAMIFRKPPNNNSPKFVEYWSAKRTKSVEGLQSIILSACDRRIIRPDEDLSDHRLWKTLWWGSHHDLQLIFYLRSLPNQLASYTSQNSKGRGYELVGGSLNADWLAEFRTLPASKFHRYGPIDYNNTLIGTPDKVYRRGKREIYRGLRLLVKRGIEEKGDHKGRIIARLEDHPFAFKLDIIGLKLPKLERAYHHVILGILWSSLARYFLFLVSTDWGGWHDTIRIDDELLTLPIMLPKNRQSVKRIEHIVETLREHVLQDNQQGIIRDVSKVMSSKKCLKLEQSLDEAIFDLYELGEEERDLIRDMCETGLDLLYGRDESSAVKPVFHSDSKSRIGTKESIPEDILGKYLRVFIEGWSTYLDNGMEMNWEAHTSPETGSMLAVVFSLYKRQDSHSPNCENQNTWNQVLERLDSALMQKVSSRIYVDGLARAVTEDFIIIIKRNERRLWTRSMAREDVEATLVQAMHRNVSTARGTE